MKKPKLPVMGDRVVNAWGCVRNGKLVKMARSTKGAIECEIALTQAAGCTPVKIEIRLVKI